MIGQPRPRENRKQQKKLEIKQQIVSNNTRTLLPSIVVLFIHWSMATADVDSTTPIAYLPPKIHIGLDPHCQIMEPKWDLKDLRKG